MNGQLCLHCGALSATLDDLEAVKTPLSTDTWEPISHSDIVSTLLTEAERVGFKLNRQSFGLSKSGDLMFGVLDFEGGNDEYGYSVGFRNSHDKSLAAGVCAGQRIFVCDNLALTGEYVEKRRNLMSRKMAVCYKIDLGSIGWTLNIINERIATITYQGKRQTSYFGFSTQEEAEAFKLAICQKNLCSAAVVRKAKRLSQYNAFEVKAWGVSTEFIVRLLNRCDSRKCS